MKRRSRSLVNAFGLAIIAVWIILILLLVKKVCWEEGTGIRIASLKKLDLELTPHESWFAIYHGRKKIGYTYSILRQGKNRYEIEEHLFMRLRTMGLVQTVAARTEAFLNPDSSLDSFRFGLKSGTIEFEARGHVKDNRLILYTGSGPNLQKTVILLAEKPFLPTGVWSYLSRSTLRVGAHYRFVIFDPMVLSERPFDLYVEAFETIPIDGKTYEAFKVRTECMGLNLYTWIGTDGERLKEEGIMGLSIVKTSKELATSGIVKDAGVDLVEAVSIPSNVTLEPNKIVYLKVRVSGIDLEGLDLDTGRQHIEGADLTIRKEALPLSYTEEGLHVGKDLSEYLKPSLLVQSNHPEIRSMASKIVGQTKGVAASRKILEWVHKNLIKRPTLSIPTALDTLERRTGDCNEHAVLLAALLRAVGIPAKVCTGLVYSKGRFYYHAWNELYLGDWITADPLMGQMPADVTHIKFVEGEAARQADIARIIGRIKLTVLESG